MKRIKHIQIDGQTLNADAQLQNQDAAATPESDRKWNSLRFIGDLHGQLEEAIVPSDRRRPYFEHLATAEYSVQVGDMGDDESYQMLVDRVDPTRHRFVPGNHEAYDSLPSHSLGNFGPAEVGGVAFFFVRGARSSDKNNCKNWKLGSLSKRANQ
ncbi:MAG: hypothetical protein R3C28_28650 [Pirellulaceae bacterium]